MKQYHLAIFTLVLLSGMLGNASDLTIHRVIPSKIIYRLNEEGTVAVTVANNGLKEQAATLRLATCWDLDSEREIAQRELRLSAGETRTITVPWNTGVERYGRAIRAELLCEGQTLARRSEFFNVIDEWWRVAVLCNGVSKMPEQRREITEYYHVGYKAYAPGHLTDTFDPQTGPFLGYLNTQFRFVPMPSSFGNQIPTVSEDVQWFSPSGYAMRTREVRRDLAACTQWGVKNTVHTIKSMNGAPGFETGRRHPEWVARTETGAFMDGGYESPDPLELAGGITRRNSGWYGLVPNLYAEETVRFGAEGIREGIREFGFDSYFFDEAYNVFPAYSPEGQKMPNGRDPDAISARNIRLTREIIHKAFPNTFLWYNGSNPQHLYGFYKSRGDNGGREGRLEMLACPKSGMMTELQGGQIVANHSWRSLFESFLSERDALRGRDWGRPLCDWISSGARFPDGFRSQIGEVAYAKTRDQWAWAHHDIVLQAAAQFHPSIGMGSGYRPMLQLMTRYSKFFWSEGMVPVRQSYRRFAVDSLREIWWEEAVYRMPEKGRDCYVFNLINAPDIERPAMDISTDPAVANDVELSLLNPPDIGKIEAWAVTPYGFGAAVKEPTQTKLTPILVDGDIVLKIPPFTYYALVVVRVKQ